jgi:hypothetical protein
MYREYVFNFIMHRNAQQDITFLQSGCFFLSSSLSFSGTSNENLCHCFFKNRLSRRLVFNKLAHYDGVRRPAIMNGLYSTYSAFWG